MSNRDVNMHNKGQADGSARRYDPPSGTWERTLGGTAQSVRDQKNYDTGYREGYSKPSGSSGGSSSSGGSGGSSSSK